MSSLRLDQLEPLDSPAQEALQALRGRLVCRVPPALAGRPDRQEYLAAPEAAALLDLPVELARRALEVIRGLPALPEKPDLLAALDSLGRVVRRAKQAHREIRDPRDPLGLLGAKGLSALRARLGKPDLMVLLEYLETLAESGLPDPSDLLVLAQLVQRGLLELDPPGLSEPARPAPPVPPATLVIPVRS